MDTDTDAGRLVARILGSVAQGEAERKSRRQVDAQAQAAAAGRRVGGRRPFGYTQDGMQVRPGEVAAIRDGYTALLAGVPLAAIARDWNARGHLRPQAGTPWGQGPVRDVLRNARNAGLRRYLSAADRAKPGRSKPDEGIIGPAAWPAIVAEETWRAAIALLADPDRRSGTPGARQLLTGLARCSLCDESVHGGGASHKQPIYRCRSGKHINRIAAPVDDYVSRVVVARLRRADARELLTADDAPDLRALRDEAAALRTRLDTVAREFADDDTLTPRQLRSITARLRARLAEVEAAQTDAGRVNVLGPLLGAADPQRVWDDLDADRRRTVIDALMVVRLLPPGRGVRGLNPDTVEIAWK